MCSVIITRPARHTKNIRAYDLETEVRLETIQITSCTIEKHQRSCEESRRKVLNEIVLSQVSITFEHLIGTRSVVL